MTIAIELAIGVEIESARVLATREETTLATRIAQLQTESEFDSEIDIDFNILIVHKRKRDFYYSVIEICKRSFTTYSIIRFDLFWPDW